MARDRRTATLFDRRDPGHQEFALKNWRDSAQTKTFVGEWIPILNPSRPRHASTFKRGGMSLERRSPDLGEHLVACHHEPARTR
jgi:hypothetical protein